MSTTYRDFKGITNSDGDIFTHPLFEEALYVNGTLQTPDDDGVITLASGGTYIVTGRHYGRIVIGASTESSLTADTFVILDGVELYANDSYAYGIYYASTSQSMYVTLARDRRNLIVCSYEQEMASNQGACLFSENNMVVQGSGYLTCINRGGHGVRASELRISGNPHVYVEAVHDAIHGNSALTVDGGYYLIRQANDAFGTGTSGSIMVFGGTFRCYGVSQNAFDSKVDGYWFCDTLDLHTDAATALSGFSACDPATYFGEASVLVDEVALEAVDGVYTIDSGTEPAVTVTGYIEGTITVSVAKTKVTLGGAYVKGSISYTLSSSNMQINSDNDTVNIVEGCITSSNNLQVEAKGGSHLIVRSDDDNAMNGSEVTLHDSKGVIMVSTSAEGKYGIQGTDIYVADSADHKGVAAEAVYGAVIADSIHARLTGKGKKSNFTTVAANLLGVLCVDSLSAETGSSSTTGINLAKSSNVFYHSLSGDTIAGDCGETYEPYSAIPYGIGTFAL